ncbi:Actin-like protein arp9 (SWI/SNF complex component arp9) [Fusarium falciforme]|nr:Actin-like protein arp9 (SWI/SNF complex component arp9) [Fusarium falciforme]
MTYHNCVKTPTKNNKGDHVRQATPEDGPAPATSPTPRYRLRARKAQPSSTPSRRSRSRRDSLQGQIDDDDDDNLLSTPQPHQNKQNRSHSINASASARRYRNRTMSSTAGKWREEQVLIICPGSRTTMAQLGCSELTPPARRMPTRMFKDGDQWAPYHRTKRMTVVNGVEEEEWVEDMDEDEGAVYPIEAGRIVNMSAFLAFLDHVHGLLTTTYHNTPIMLMASPQWTRPDCETIARYIFENTRTPALCIIHSGIATQYGLKWPNMTVVDIGYQKVDVTAIHDGRVVNHMDVGASEGDSEISGGEVFTRSLLKLLEEKGFNYDMAEQLKKSAICEVLPYVATAEDLMELPQQNTAGLKAGGSGSSAGQQAASSASKPAAANGDETNGNGDDDGVLDVAAIVTSGQTKEFLAKKEKEKEKGKPGRKPKGDKEADNAAKVVRLPNSKRSHNSFSYEEIIQEEVPKESVEKQANSATVPEGEKKEGETNGAQPQPQPQPQPQGDATTAAPATTEAPKPAEGQEQTQPSVEPKPEANPTPAPPANEVTERRPKRIQRNVEVGLERFKFAQRREIDRIVYAIYRTIQGVDDMYMRPACWDNLVFVGNGSRLRGLRENILQTLQARHLGRRRPRDPSPACHTSSLQVASTPFLQAATAAAAGGANNALTPQAASEAGGPATGHHFHSQTPTSIKTATLPSYLGEWTKNGFEESMFLGAQVAARIAFCVHSNMDAQTVEAQRLMSLSRVDYNELGPKGIRTHSMLG